SINTKENAALAAQTPDGVEIVAEAAGKLDKAQADQASPGIEPGAEVIDLDACAAAGDKAHLDTARAKIHPRINVGGIFLGGDHEIVAVAPGQSLGDEADALAGVFDKGDIERIDAQELPKLTANFLDLLEPTALVGHSIVGHVIGPGAKSLACAFRQRRNRGMIEEGPVAGDRELRTE